MKKEVVLGIVRHLFTFLGGVLVTRGLLDAELMVEISGAIITIIGGIWSIANKAEKNEK